MKQWKQENSFNQPVLPTPFAPSTTIRALLLRSVTIVIWTSDHTDHHLILDTRTRLEALLWILKWRALSFTRATKRPAEGF